MSNALICPSCNTPHDLSDYINATDADMAFKVALDVPAPLSNLVLQYTQLFAPAKSKLSLNRRANIIKDLHLEGTDVQRIAYGIRAMLERHNNGDLVIPLRNHNYLFKVMQSYTPPAIEEKNKFTLTPKQMKFFASKLARNNEFGMRYAKIGEDINAFQTRIEAQLQDPKQVEQWQNYIDQIKE